jgi:RecB family exonuclease
MPANRLFVVPTTRARRDRLFTACDPQERVLTIKELKERLAYIPQRFLIDETAQILALKKASERLKSGDRLGVPKDFLVFLEHAPFFLKFFGELSEYGIEPEALLGGDNYAQYDDHIAILTELKKLYREELSKAGYIDRAALAEEYRLNLSWLKEFDEVFITIEGVLTPYEIRLLEAIAKTLPLAIEIYPTPFDKRLKNALEPIAQLAAIKEVELKLENDFRFFYVQERLEQASAIMSEVFYYVDKGVKPDRIAVVLADETFAAFLRRLDRHNIFNYAMGISFKETIFYRRLKAILNYDENRASNAYINRFKIDKNYDNLEALLRYADESKSVNEIASDTLEELAPLLSDKSLKQKDRLRLYLQTLSNKTIDDSSGGKVTVMGALETRAVSFDAAIVADFNDDKLPRRSVKDLFINAAVRARAMLPTYADREDNERSFYWRLFARAKYKTILCVQNDLSEPSRFAKELGIKNEPEIYPLNAELSPPFTPLKKREIDTIELEIDLLNDKISASKLKTYLACKRKFYYRYIKGYKEDDRFDERSISLEMGDLLHRALSICETKAQTIDYLRQNVQGDPRLEFELILWQERLKKYFEIEKERFKSGWQTIMREKEFCFDYNGAKLNGKIDRVDKNGNEYLAIDYKSGKVPLQRTPEKQSEFQLTIYRLFLLSEGYDDVKTYYYDLVEAKLAEYDHERYEEAFDQALDLYREKRQVFELCESRSHCQYCPYTTLCGRF